MWEEQIGKRQAKGLLISQAYTCISCQATVSRKKKKKLNLIWIKMTIQRQNLDKIWSCAKVWALLTISIVFIYKLLGVWIRNVILIYQITVEHSNISEVKRDSLDQQKRCNMHQNKFRQVHKVGHPNRKITPISSRASF